MTIKIDDKDVQMTEQNKYYLRGTNFIVEIVRTLREGHNIMPNENAWCLYVIIGEKHSLYRKACMNTSDYDTELGDKIYPNFHCGCTYYKKETRQVKIGCDYQHLGDEYIYQNLSTDIPDEILQDAKDLYKWFKEN